MGPFGRRMHARRTALEPLASRLVRLLVKQVSSPLDVFDDLMATIEEVLRTLPPEQSDLVFSAAHGRLASRQDADVLTDMLERLVDHLCCVVDEDGVQRGILMTVPAFLLDRKTVLDLRFDETWQSALRSAVLSHGLVSWCEELVVLPRVLPLNLATRLRPGQLYQVGRMLATGQRDAACRVVFETESRPEKGMRRHPARHPSDPAVRTSGLLLAYVATDDPEPFELHRDIRAEVDAGDHDETGPRRIFEDDVVEVLTQAARQFVKGAGKPRLRLYFNGPAMPFAQGVDMGCRSERRDVMHQRLKGIQHALGLTATDQLRLLSANPGTTDRGDGLTVVDLAGPLESSRSEELLWEHWPGEHLGHAQHELMVFLAWHGIDVSHVFTAELERHGPVRVGHPSRSFDAAFEQRFALEERSPDVDDKGPSGMLH